MKVRFDELDWKDVLSRAGLAEFLSNKQGPCPLCQGKTRFRFDNKNDAGTWYCNSCGAGNGYTLLRSYLGGDRQVFEFLKDTGLCRAVPEASPLPSHREARDAAEKAARDRQKKRDKLNATWKGSIALTEASPVWQYLRRRVPSLQLQWLSGDLLEHPSLEYWEESSSKWHFRGRWPAMVAVARRPTGKPVTLHRTYLSLDGFKAPLAEVKKQMASPEKLLGAAILLNHPAMQSRKLIVCEGIETGLALVAATGNRIEVWALLNAGNLAVADVPRERFDEVIICADRDPLDPRHGWRPGEHYAELLKARLLSEGFICKLHVPTGEKNDFCDLLQRARHLRLVA